MERYTSRLRRRTSQDDDKSDWSKHSDNSARSVPIGSGSEHEKNDGHVKRRRKNGTKFSWFASVASGVFQVIIGSASRSRRKMSSTKHEKVTPTGGHQTKFVVACLVLFGIVFLLTKQPPYNTLHPSFFRGIFMQSARLDEFLAESSSLRPSSDIPLLFDHLLGNPQRFRMTNFQYTKGKIGRAFSESDDESSSLSTDYGGIVFRLLDEGQSRQIYHDLKDRKRVILKDSYSSSDSVDSYFAFDDDHRRNSARDFFDDDEVAKMRPCRRTSWYRYEFPSCLSFHEIDFSRNVPRLVGDGNFRQVFIHEHVLPKGLTEKIVFKELKFEEGFEYKNRETVRMDALVSERLTSTETIVDIYGYCGLSMLSEAFEFGDIENEVVGFTEHGTEVTDPRDEEELTVHNKFTPSQKLKLALAMAEPLAALHNYEGGAIVHDDLDLGQYLWTDETKTSVKLNDFNRAELMLYDEKHHQFCEYKNGHGHGYWRAPEEFADEGLSSKIDVYSLGNNFYSLLTGMTPYFDHDNDEAFQMSVRHGRFPPIDPRFRTNSYAEGKLVDVIQRCHVLKPEERADINEVIKMLQDAIAEDERRQQTNEHGEG